MDPFTSVLEDKCLFQPQLRPGVHVVSAYDSVCIGSMCNMYNIAFESV